MKWSLFVTLSVLLFGWFTISAQAGAIFEKPINHIWLLTFDKSMLEKEFTKIMIIGEPKIGGIKLRRVIRVDGPKTMWMPRTIIHWRNSADPYYPSHDYIPSSSGLPKWGENFSDP